MHQVNKKYNVANEKGMTLIEILVVLFISSLVIGSLFNMISWNLKLAFSSVTNQSEVEQYRIFTSTISEDLKFAQHIEIKNEGDIDKLSYVRIDGLVVKYQFEKDGLYKMVNNEKYLISKGTAHENGFPKVYLIGNGFIRFNFFAENINSLLFLTIKPKIYDINEVNP